MENYLISSIILESEISNKKRAWNTWKLYLYPIYIYKSFIIITNSSLSLINSQKYPHLFKLGDCQVLIFKKYFKQGE